MKAKLDCVQENGPKPARESLSADETHRGAQTLASPTAFLHSIEYGGFSKLGLLFGGCYNKDYIVLRAI